MIVVVVTDNRAAFRDRILDAHRAIVALESIEAGEKAVAISLVLAEGTRAHRQLVQLRDSSNLMPSDAAFLQVAVDLLQAKLKFFGTSV
jgi:hypothetical protein